MRAQVEELQKTAREFSASLAAIVHETSGAANNILTCTDHVDLSLLRGTQPDKTIVQRLERATDYFIVHIHDLRAFTRLGYQQLLLQIHEFDPAENLMWCIENMQEKAREHGQQLHFTSNTNYMEICSDPMRIGQIIENLATNAIKYGASDIHVSLEAVTVDGESRLRLIVQDSGPGMSSDDMERLFKPFTRIHATEVRGFLSTGMGLYIVKTLVTALHGTLHVDSEPGKGTRFDISFPNIPVPE